MLLKHFVQMYVMMFSLHLKIVIAGTVMDIINNIKDMQSYSESIRKDGLRIGFVPTMGALHSGHMALVEYIQKFCDCSVVSIFVNPTQFTPGEDFDNYPRKLEDDTDKLSRSGVNVLFAPQSADMYGDDYKTYVEVKGVQDHLCGKHRPGHFRGVATIVLKLINITKPHYAVFGEKDYQQLQIIKKMVDDLNIDVEILGYPLVREEDGLAMSSRNRYLNSEKRSQATSISKALFQVKEMFERGISSSAELCIIARDILNESGINDIDYISIVDNKLLEVKEIASSGDIVAMAARVGGARLIDNIKL